MGFEQQQFVASVVEGSSAVVLSSLITAQDLQLPMSSASNSSSLYRKIGYITAVGIAGISILFAGLVTFQSKIIYMPRTYQAMNNYYNRVLNRKDLIKFNYSINNDVHNGYYIHINEQEKEKDPKSIQRIYLMFGGNAALSLDWINSIDSYKNYLSELGIINYTYPTTFLLLDYPGYDINPGSPSPQTILFSTQMALKQLIEAKQWQKNTIKLGLIGHSLGSACCLQFADIVTRKNDDGSNSDNNLRNINSDKNIILDKLILLSPFTSMLDMARSLLGRIPMLNYLLNHNFDNRFHLTHLLRNLQANNNPNNKSKENKLQLLIAHGSVDRIVPVEMGRELGILASNPEYSAVVDCNYQELQNIDHNDIFGPIENSLFQMMAENDEK
jgi:pimeloyl-ACP methyl ester carboxylesterase